MEANGTPRGIVLLVAWFGGRPRFVVGVRPGNQFAGTSTRSAISRPG